MLLHKKGKVVHLCGLPAWAMCTVCDGRIHLDGCTSRRNKLKDCCPARHQMLHEQGQTRGIFDAGVVMWDPAIQTGSKD